MRVHQHVDRPVRTQDQEFVKSRWDDSPLSCRPSIEAAGYHCPPRYRTNRCASSSVGPSAITFSMDLSLLAHSCLILPGFPRARTASARPQPFCQQPSKAPLHPVSRLGAEDDLLIEASSTRLRRKHRSSKLSYLPPTAPVAWQRLRVIPRQHAQCAWRATSSQPERG
jgi:hypothetical protein